jgi:hypothetical protein
MDDDEPFGPGRARHTDPETSHEAARLRDGTAAREAIDVYGYAHPTPRAYDDLIVAMYEGGSRRAISGIASLPAVLLRRGLIEEAGWRDASETRYGRRQRLRRLTAKGLELFASRLPT